jgi:cold shock protein
MTGTVRYWHSEKAFGLIEAEDRVVFFVHVNAVMYQEPLRRGQVVRFDAAESPRGPRATNVQVLAPSAADARA